MKVVPALDEIEDRQARLATWVLKRRRASSSHSSVAKKLSHLALATPRTLVSADVWTGGWCSTVTSINCSTNEVKSTLICPSPTFANAATSLKER